MDERSILRFERLVDVSPVVSPAYEATGEEGALAPVTAGRASTALDRRLADAERLMRAEAALLGSSLTTTAVREAGTGSARRLVPVGAVERRYVSANVVVG